MGSEGYLINEFLVTRTNRRADRWGGSWQNRMRLPLEILARTRAAGGPRIHHHLSPVDARPRRWRRHLGGGLDRPRPSSVQAPRSSTPASAGTKPGFRLSRRWSRAQLRPGSRAAFAARSSIPLVTSNRMADPAVADRILANGDRRPRFDGAPAARRPGFRRGSGERPRGRDQYLHRLQPGLPRPRVRE